MRHTLISNCICTQEKSGKTIEIFIEQMVFEVSPVDPAPVLDGHYTILSWETTYSFKSMKIVK